MKSLVLNVLYLLLIYGASGVEADVVESVSVIEGDSLTLHTHVTEIQKVSVIVWTFGESVIARIDSEYNENKISHVETFRVKLDNQTGDLKIRKIRITDFGFYKLVIYSVRGTSSKTFNVSGVINLASDGVKFVAVLERDSVILPSGLPEIQRDDQITWKFEDKLVARINQAGIFPDDVLNGRFKDRLRLNKHTGSLTITNVRPNISGLYEVDITKNGSGYTTHKTFNVTSIDVGNKLSVTEGTSLTLESGVSTIHSDDVIMWRSEHGDSLIAKISTGVCATFDGADGRFRDSLELDRKSGSLTIRNIRGRHDGLYHLDIIGNRRTIFKRFNITVRSRHLLPWAILAICIVVLLVVGGTIVGIFLRHKGELRTSGNNV